MVRSFESGLAQEAVKRGLTAGQLVERVMGALDGGEEQTAPTGSPGGGGPSGAAGGGDVEVFQVTPGWWNVRVDGRLMSDKNLRERDAQDLGDTFRVQVGAGVEEDENSY